ncbi:MAG: eukaryotic-like serine/threonine-protein kinase [Thermoleophilaceae bacterium]|nr:eukaryotic-like serine/threonine-protein kinase [Thermoleophilaceae bacterium]
MITCPSCSHENPGDANFCGRCGTMLPQEVTCGQCGRANPADLRFCRGCGGALQATAAAGNGTPGGNGATAPGGAPKELDDGRYVLERFLGEGGRKRVYLAHDTALDRDVAVAIVKTLGLTEAGRVRVRREAQAMARLGDHPHIVTVHDIGEESGEPYIVSQYMAGGALADVLAQAPDGRLDLETLLNVAESVCGALDHAHAHGIVHRDLKPANIWLTADGTAKLGDFGLAFSVDQERVTRAGAIIGTAAYMPPEQALGQQVDAQSDLYSLGAMLYEMATGRPPFVGDDVVSVISQHANAEPVAPSWHDDAIPDELERLILELLAKTPAERPQGAAQVRERIGEVRRAMAATAARSDDGEARQRSDESRVESLAEGVFVGRELEVDKLRAGLEDALAGHGRLLLLVGEPGIGKTRTAQEIVTYARLRGARVLIGRCHETEGAPAYWPWVQMARSYIAASDDAEAVMRALGAGAADIARVIPEVRDMLPGSEPPRSLEPEQARFRFFDAVTTFLRNVAELEPLVLVVDDLHWADAPSLRLLQFLARELSDTRIVVLGTYRDVELGRRHPLSQALADLSREGLVERVTLRGLSEPEVARFIEVVANIEPPPALVRAIFEETEGNPFFVSEIVNLLASEGDLNDPVALSEWTVTIPQGVREVVGRRLDRLSEDCNRVLAIASVVGREFSVEVLGRVAELPRDRLLELLEEAEGERIVDEATAPSMRYSFSHALVREALYEELGTTQRVRLHRRIAEVIEEICGDDREPHLDELAHHFLEAQELERAIEYSEAAANRSIEVMAFEEAAELYGKAVQALELRQPAPGRRHAELLVALGMSQSRAGDGRRARATFRRASEIARGLGENDLFAAAVLGLALWLEIGIIDNELTDLIEEALAKLGGADSEIRARLLVRLSTAVYFSRPHERERLAREAVDMARRVGDPGTLAAVLEHAHYTLSTPARTEDRVAIATELIEAAERAGDSEMAIEGHGMRLIDLLELGDVEGVDREMAIYSRGAMSLREPNFLRYATIRRAMRALLAGRFDQVEPILEKHSPRLARHQLEPNTVQAFGVVMFNLRRLQGRTDEVDSQIRAFASQYPAVPAWRTALALLDVEVGNDEAATKAYDELIADEFALLPRDANWLTSLTLLAEGVARLRLRDHSAEIYNELLPFANRNVVVGGGWVCHGSTSRFLGMLAAVLERYDDAERHFAVAIQMNQRLKARPLVALTRADYAEMLAERGDDADLERANELIGEALRVGGEIGMRGLVERAFGLRVRLQGIDSADVRSSLDAVASEVEEERPDLSGHTAPDGTVTILFSDIEGSTEINERLGDRRWLEVLREHNAIVRDAVRLHGGFEVKSAGDGFMIVFARPRSGVECAVAIQRSLQARLEDGGEPIRVRMGLHTGEAIRERDDFFGRNVVVAARIAAKATGGEVLVSAPLRELADGASDIAFGAPRELGLKGLQGTYRVYTVEWDLAAAGASA